VATKNSWNNNVLDANVTFTGGTMSIGTDSTDNAINIGTAASSGRTTTIGNATGTSPLVLIGGSTGATLDATGVIEINSSAGAISIGNDAVAQAINIGTGAAARTVTVGNTTGATALALNMGTGDLTLASASGTIMSALDSGEITQPLQPAFSAYLSSTQSNVTGDNTAYTIIFDTERFDQGSDYNNATGVFTAPVTGRYLLTTGISFDGSAGGGIECYIQIVTSNITYRVVSIPTEARVTGFYGVSGNLIWGTGLLVDMDASDTAYVSIASFSGSKTDTVTGASTTMITYFTGKLDA